MIENFELEDLPEMDLSFPELDITELDIKLESVDLDFDKDWKPMEFDIEEAFKELGELVLAPFDLEFENFNIELLVMNLEF
jgi:hypothetical protein